MTEQEKDQLKNTLRVVLNSIQLLQEGVFPGKHAVPILEGGQFLQGLAKELESKLKESSIIMPSKELAVVSADSVPTKA